MGEPFRMSIHSETTGNVLWLRRGDRFYLYDPDHLVDTMNDQRNITRLSSVEICGGYRSGDQWFIFYAEDCFQPSLHAIQAEEWGEAYEQFIEQEAERGHYLVTEESDPEKWAEIEASAQHGNMPDNIALTDDGYVHTECFQGFAVEFYAFENRPIPGEDD
jgi:hypothetical protein